MRVTSPRTAGGGKLGFSKHTHTHTACNTAVAAKLCRFTFHWASSHAPRVVYVCVWFSCIEKAAERSILLSLWSERDNYLSALCRRKRNHGFAGTDVDGVTCTYIEFYCLCFFPAIENFTIRFGVCFRRRMKISGRVFQVREFGPC